MTNIESELESKARILADSLVAQGLTIATAESCTGGWIAQTVTALPGSSNWFDRGYVTYSNRAKMEVLGVSTQTLESCGAVSSETAAEMAAGALRAAHVDLTVAVTGIAGPDGGSPEKPVGTVWFGWCRGDLPPKTTRMCFDGDRQAVRAQTVALALDGLIELAAVR